MIVFFALVLHPAQEVLPYLNIYMSEAVTDEERAELDELGIAVTYTGDEPADKWEKSENW